MNFLEKTQIWLPGIKKYVQDMKECEQDPVWHGEIYVWEHVKMVLDEVEKLKIKEEDKDLLRWVALLHDIGKPGCSTIEDGHIRSHGHSKRGYHIAMSLLEETHLDNDQKQEILNIIRQHGEPNWILEKDDPEREVIRLSMCCRLDLLYNFVKCDILGRISEDKHQFLENLEYFKTISKDLDCFYKPYKFKSDIAKFNYFVKRTHHHTDIPYDDTKSKVYMVCGLPGSGKDTYINKALSWLPVISLDEIRKEFNIKPTDEQGKVIQTAKERARQYMRKGEDFVWNATNTTKRLRKEIISFFTEYNSYISINFINNSLEVILEQNKNRDQKVPENVIMKLYKKLEIPTEDECHTLSFYRV
jgi:putative nucleotidyltransferase with HDIG domain